MTVYLHNNRQIRFLPLEKYDIRVCKENKQHERTTVVTMELGNGEVQ